jgi:hypothetical protein
MPRILRNYLISFAIIGVLLLAIHLVNRWAERQAPPPAPPAVPTAPTVPSVPSGR